jgi:hypothetical protein
LHAAIPQLAARFEFACRATWFGARRWSLGDLVAELGWEPLGRDIDCDRKIEPGHERVDAGAQVAACQGTGQDAVGQVAQFAVALL